MKKAILKAMMISISEVMENMFFLTVESEGESTLEACGLKREQTLACQLAFTGDTSGSMVIISPMILVDQMAENFMGETKEQLTDEHLTGTLTEMLNMVCGNALSKIKSKQPFELGIPEIVEETPFSPKELFTIINTGQSKMAIYLKLN